MIVKCYNCGVASPDKEEWELVAKFKWSARSKRALSGGDWKAGESLDEAFERVGKDWYCPDCFFVNMDSTFNLPARTSDRKN